MMGRMIVYIGQIGMIVVKQLEVVGYIMNGILEGVQVKMYGNGMEVEEDVGLVLFVWGIFY